VTSYINNWTTTTADDI